MTVDEAEARYVEEGGRSCPECGESVLSIRRLCGEARSILKSPGERILALPCYCARCGESWVERYRLEWIVRGGKS